MKLYLGDYRDIVSDVKADILLTDPPYGINYKVNKRAVRGNIGANHGTEYKNPIMNDTPDIELADILHFPKMAIFGANHLSRKIPAGGKWIVWDKRRDSTPDSHSDCEFIWTNVKGADRIHRQKWRGIIREGEENVSKSRKLHPNQKPVALLTFILKELGAEPGMTVFDPYMGSGSSGIAAVRLSLKFIGCEISQDHYKTARERIQKECEL